MTPSGRSGCDLPMQSAGLLIICHMREETSEQPTNFTHDVIVEDRFIGRIDLTPLIVRTVNIPVKSVAPAIFRRAGQRRMGLLPLASARRKSAVIRLSIARTISILDAQRLL